MGGLLEHKGLGCTKFFGDSRPHDFPENLGQSLNGLAILGHFIRILPGPNGSKDGPEMA